MVARMIVVLIGVMGLGVVGCASRSAGPVPATPVGGWGRFSGEVAEVQLLGDGRKAKLLKAFAYTDPRGLRWVAPVGDEIDGASIPRELWSVVGGPYEGRYRFASIVHDHYCVAHEGRRWQDVHQMFYEACLAGGTDPQLAKLMYGAVYLFGPRWDDPRPQGIEKLQELIAPERLRLAAELEDWEAGRVAAAATRPAVAMSVRPGSRPTQADYRNLVLAPRERVRAMGVTAAPRVRTPTVLEKWDRVREMIRANPNVSLEEIRAVGQ